MMQNQFHTVTGISGIFDASSSSNFFAVHFLSNFPHSLYSSLFNSLTYYVSCDTKETLFRQCKFATDLAAVRTESRAVQRFCRDSCGCLMTNLKIFSTAGYEFPHSRCVCLSVHETKALPAPLCCSVLRTRHETHTESVHPSTNSPSHFSSPRCSAKLVPGWAGCCQFGAFEVPGVQQTPWNCYL